MPLLYLVEVSALAAASCTWLKLYLVEAIEVQESGEVRSVRCLRSFQNLSEIISGWLELEEERFWARPTSTKVGTELTKVGTELTKVGTELNKSWN